MGTGVGGRLCGVLVGEPVLGCAAELGRRVTQRVGRVGERVAQRVGERVAQLVGERVG